eukprot:jgi/Undpi1/2627/HiC_scaffold_13.g06006.m1
MVGGRYHWIMPDGDGAATTSDGAAAEATADGSSPASAMDVDSDNAVGASGFHQTNITPLLSGPSNIDSTVNLLQSIVNKDIAKLDSGEIAELSPQTMELMSRLQYDAISLRAASGKAGSSSGGSGSGGATSSGPKGKSFKGKSPMGDKFPKGARTDKERPKCTHPTCKSKVGHWLEECWTRQREERDARRARATSKRNKGGGGGNGGGKRSKKAPTPDDDDDN